MMSRKLKTSVLGLSMAKMSLVSVNLDKLDNIASYQEKEYGKTEAKIIKVKLFNRKV